jgi:hypothetical protein
MMGIMFIIRVVCWGKKGGVFVAQAEACMPLYARGRDNGLPR